MTTRGVIGVPGDRLAAALAAVAAAALTTLLLWAITGRSFDSPVVVAALAAVVAVSFGLGLLRFAEPEGRTSVSFDDAGRSETTVEAGWTVAQDLVQAPLIPDVVERPKMIEFVQLDQFVSALPTDESQCSSCGAFLVGVPKSARCQSCGGDAEASDIVLLHSSPEVNHGI